MATISKWGLVALAALLAGCADTPAYATNKLSWPSARLMKAPAALPSVPQEEGNPAVRAPYLASTISQCSATADQVRGLQDYARAIHSK